MDIEYLETARREIEQWESRRPGFVLGLSDFVLRPAENAARALVPARLQDVVTKAIQGFLSGLGSAAHLVSNEAKIYHKVETAYQDCGDELKAADTVAKHFWNWNLAYGTGEGGTTGLMGLAGLAADVPSLITVSLRLIQQIGICHGYDVRADEEQEYVMHVLRIGSTASHQAKMESLLVLRPVEQVLLKVSWRKMSETIARREIRYLSLRTAMQEFARTLGIQLTRRKALQLAPVVGALIGASCNAQFVNDVGRTAYMLYRRRRIAQLEGPSTTILDLPQVTGVTLRA
ncbi:MAG: EcsC family protein [Planctomycetota bacterium]